LLAYQPVVVYQGRLSCTFCHRASAPFSPANPPLLPGRLFSGLQEDIFCDEFVLADLRVFDNCKKVVEGCEHVFNLAADMGGMGFIQSNHSVIMYNNTSIS
jgi:hypothetical protein